MPKPTPGSEGCGAFTDTYDTVSATYRRRVERRVNGLHCGGQTARLITCEKDSRAPDFARLRHSYASRLTDTVLVAIQRSIDTNHA